jgi:hypothetical protein
MKIYIVEYWDWSDVTEIKGVFTDKHKADKCLEYEQMLIDISQKEYGNHGENTWIEETEISDDVDFDAKIKELEENERKKQQAQEDAIKEADLVEFNRIKEKYGL